MKEDEKIIEMFFVRSENTVDNTKRQWAYVKWTVLEDEED